MGPETSLTSSRAGNRCPRLTSPARQHSLGLRPRPVPFVEHPHLLAVQGEADATVALAVDEEVKALNDDVDALALDDRRGAVRSAADDVIVATTNASLFAYVADGRNGMRVGD